MANLEPAEFARRRRRMDVCVADVPGHRVLYALQELFHSCGCLAGHELLI